MRIAALEQINAYTMQGALNLSALNAVFQWIDSQATIGRITTVQAGQVKERIGGHAYNNM